MEVEQYLLKVYEVNKLSEITIKQIQKIIADLVNMLKQIDYSNFQTSNISFTSFGSYLNGFGTSTSDVDFTILTNCYIQEPFAIRSLSQAIYKQIEKQKKEQKYQYLINKTLPDIRIPLIQLKDQYNNQELDLCINNILGAVNTRLLKAYAELHIKIAQGGILLKIWGKKGEKKLINQNDFSSYAITLMWICFLQRKMGIPNLQNKKYKPKNYIMISKQQALKQILFLFIKVINIKNFKNSVRKVQIKQIYIFYQLIFLNIINYKVKHKIINIQYQQIKKF